MKKVFFLFSLVILCSCNMNKTPSQDKQAPTDSTTADSLLSMSHSYEGIIPCADCEGIQYRLTLSHAGQNGNGTYESSMTYMGKEETFTSTGFWKVVQGINNTGEVIYQLDPEKPESTSYLLSRGDSLIMLDNNMKQAESGLNYTLKAVK